jgi:GT2 family glycosyltransferase/glycosyltransferase involved in cell wall biosynthesis
VFYLRTAFSARNAVREIEPGLFVVEQSGPSAYSLYRSEMSHELVGLVAHELLSLFLAMGIERLVILVQLPTWEPLARMIRAHTNAPIVFDYIDDYAGFDDDMLSHEVVAATEARLLRAANLLLAPARSLRDRAAGVNANTVLLPNAGEFEHFSQPTAPAPELQDLAGPIVGYWGAISTWFDVDLLESLARARPNYNFVLIGYPWTPLHSLEDLPNVHLLGPRPYADLPGFLAGFAAALIPFRQVELIKHTNPVKIFEYFARGVPVVSVPLPELHPFRDLIEFGSDAESFLAGLDRAVAENDPDRRRRRIEVAVANSWDDRVQTLLDATAPLLPPAPRISMVLVTHNNQVLTRIAVESVIRNTGLPNAELILVDNQSTDGTTEMLAEYARRYRRVRLIARDVNDSFARACNIGLQAATGEFLAILNNDIVVTHGWLSRLIWHLESDPRLGMVGPVTSFAGNEAMIPTNYRTMAEMHAFALDRRARYPHRRTGVPMLALFCVAFRRTLIDEIGLIDERFATGMFEDDDFCRRIQSAGYHLAVAEDVFVHHFGKASFSLLEDDEYRRVWDENQRKFEEKWEVAWAPQGHR